ncbi:hypothetical protein I79_020779 [Cricetulus griseus]|uniref:Uncharacterized protein n=1 Tax=Cricetulus griseus TaxID=10029 RepID=G3IAZ3_CRIGR|nr:hypothetical protein I79_020779 [Cricetulus griseus]
MPSSQQPVKLKEGCAEVPLWVGKGLLSVELKNHFEACPRETVVCAQKACRDCPVAECITPTML